MAYWLLLIPALIAGYYLLSLLIAFCEKDHLRGDLVAQSYSPDAWKSDYLRQRHEQALAMGLTHCGDFHTGVHASLVKGPMRLYVNKARTAIIAVISARFLGLELKKTVARSRLSAQRTLETSDFGATADPTRGIEPLTLWGADLDEVLSTHEARMQAELAPAAVKPEAAFALYEQIEMDRGQRMVDRQLARWTDRTQRSIRRTFQGALGTLRANKAQSDAIVAREKKRIAANGKK
jgi:hypothetical protein